mgnify:CR=1 FL=1
MNPIKKTRKVKIIIASVGIVLLAVILAAVHFIGPLFGFWLIPPSPKAHGKYAISLMDRGLHANTPQWQTKRAEALDAIGKARSREEVTPIIEDALKVAGGKHSFLTTDEQRKEDETLFELPTSQADGGVITVHLPGYSGTSEQGQQYADTVANALTASGACGAIIDLTMNDGGDMGPMLAGLSPLLPNGEVVTFNTSLGDMVVTLEGGSVKGGGTPTKTDAGATKLNIPVAIITSTDTASSGEQALLAFRGLDNVRVFGQPSAGYASVNQGFPLYGGLLMQLTVGETIARTSEHFGEIPIDPDEVVSLDEAPTTAREWLASKGCN